MRNAVSEVETAKFFGRDAIKEEGGKLNIDKSIGELVAREIRDGKISGKQAIELDSILKSRHGPGNQTSNRYLQDMKNISNMGLLGDFVSTISQGQDLFLATYLNGFRATGMAMVDMAAGRSKVNMKDFGLIDHVSEEFVSSRTSAKALQKVFKYSFFTGMDSIGKTVVLNGALKNATNKLASETGEAKFRSKWEPRFGSDYPQLVKDLKAGESTELTDTLAFSQLSKLQPVTKIEMPQKYLDMPNGRVIYMLKSFMLKQFDLARNDIYNELKEGNIKDGMANFARLTLLLGFGGAAADAIRDAMLYGFKNITFKTSDVADQVLKNFGLNTFVLNKVKAGKLGEALTSMIVPPLTMFDPVFQDMKAELDGDPDTESSHKSWKFIPLVGKTLYSRYGGGKEKELDKRDRQNQ